MKDTLIPLSIAFVGTDGRVVSISDFFFFKQKTAYEMVMSDWSSDVCSSDLVHRDIDGDSAGLHRGNHAAGHKLRRLSTEDEHGPYQKVRLRDGILDVKGIRHQGLDLGEEDIVQITQPVGIEIEDGYARSESDRHLRRIGPHGAATDDHDVGGRDAGHASEELTQASVGPLKIVRADLDRHSARHLTHWRQ